MSAQHTPGPWAWFGNRSGGVYLATPDRGRRHIMGFQRYGMNGAQPSFCVGHIMRPAAELVSFAVGDNGVRGFKQAAADPSVYRYDVAGIDHPDARLIAASPDLYDALAALLVATLAFEVVTAIGSEGKEYRDACLGLTHARNTASAALAKARGEA